MLRHANDTSRVIERFGERFRKWSAEARINAAELLVGQGVEQYEPALEAVADFEDKHPDSELVGRLLALRIRANRGLRRFERATAILEQYLQSVSPEKAGAVLASTSPPSFSASTLKGAVEQA